MRVRSRTLSLSLLEISSGFVVYRMSCEMPFLGHAKRGAIHLKKRMGIQDSFIAWHSSWGRFLKAQ